jgi:class 3 adenylate cyclase/tetratricopeptide (TPR) repeat protein
VAGTQNITVLFTDLVGSTELSSSLSPEVADEVRRAHFSALREAISAAGGTEVKNLGDGLMVGFDATAPALSCAVAMQQGIERRNRKSPVSLAIRIGISTGDVTVEEGDYFGDPVVEAARLCAVAQAGQILATEAAKLLARRSGHSFITERELELKGLPEPVVAWEVVWEPAETEMDTSGMALPPRLPQAPGTGLVGRKVEQERLNVALKAVVAGEPAHVVLVAGEAGVGKSSLTSSLARDAHHDGALVLYGRCDEDLAVPHQPFVEALGHYFSHVDDAAISALGDDHLSSLIRLVPELHRRRPELAATTSSDPDAERWLLYGAVLALLEAASRDAAVVMILDDLHWADRPSLQLLRHVASHRPGRVLVLGTYRETDLSASHPLTETLAALTREPAVTRMSLSGLEDDEVVSFVEAAAGQTLDEAGVGLAHALYHETDGNPFFMAEVLRHLVETRAIVQEESGRWVPTQELSEAGLPDSVRQVIGARVGRLGDGATSVLSAASVLGQEFDVDLLAEVVGAAEDPVLDVLEAAGSSALVAEVRDTSGRFRFTHALIQHTLYDDLGRTRRSRLHRAAAEALEERLGEDPGHRAGELARHWLAATRPIESKKAVSYARRAGENALASLAPAEAMRWFNEALGALAHAPDDKERARCLVGLGEAKRQVGDHTYRETLLEAAHLAHGLGDVDTLVRAALANNRGWQSAAGMVDRERLEVLATALDAIDQIDTPTRARLLALLALERTFAGDYETRRALADEALEIARRCGDAATILDVRLRLVEALWHPDTIEDQFADSEEIESLAERLGDHVGKFWAAFFRSDLAVQVGDASNVARWHEELDELATEVGQPTLLWGATFQRTWSSLLFGDVGKAEVLASEALRIGTDSGQPDALVLYGAQLFHVRWFQGRLGELVDLVREIAEGNPGIVSYRPAWALTLVEANRADEARDLLQQETTLGFPGADDYLLPTYLQAWANVAYALNDTEAAGPLYRRLLRWPNLVAFTGATVNGAVAEHLALLATVLGLYDEADDHFVRAMKSYEGLSAPFFIALTQLEWSQLLLERRAEGDLTHAEMMLGSARDTAQRCGFAAVERRAREALAGLS